MKRIPLFAFSFNGQCDVQEFFCLRMPIYIYISLLELIIQRALNINKEIITCFVDYEKAFDREANK